MEVEAFERQVVAPSMWDVARGHGSFARARFTRLCDGERGRDAFGLGEATRLGGCRHMAVADPRALPLRSRSFPSEMFVRAPVRGCNPQRGPEVCTVNYDRANGRSSLCRGSRVCHPRGRP